MPDVKCVLIHDNFQNFKSYNIPKAQLVITDIPYNIGTDFYASRPDCANGLRGEVGGLKFCFA